MSIAVRGPASGKEVPSASRSASSASKIEVVCAQMSIHVSRAPRAMRFGSNECSAAKDDSASKLASSRRPEAASSPTSAT